MQLAVADNSVPPKLIVFAVFGLVWLLSAIFGKKKPTTIVPTTARRGPGIGIPASVRVPSPQARVPAPPPMPKQRGHAKAKPQPVTVTQAVQLARQPARAAVAPQSNVAPPLIAPKRASTETARNLRLLLQKGGVREAFLMSEILSPPMSMRE